MKQGIFTNDPAAPNSPARALRALILGLLLAGAAFARQTAGRRMEGAIQFENCH